MKELADLAREMGYEVEWVDKWSGGLLKINGKYFGYGLIPKFPLNNAMSRQLAKDKVYSYILMEKNGIEVPEGNYFFRPDERYSAQVEGKGIDEAKKYAEELDYPIFIKPNRGALGKNCMKVENIKELQDGLNQIWKNDYIALVQKNLIGKEYRVMFLDGEILLLYEKSKPFVEGDGVLTICQLINNISGSPISERVASDSRMTVREKVLEKGERCYLSDVANLSGGGVVVGVVDEYGDELKDLVKKIADILGLVYGGIDFIGDDINNIDGLKVLEVNADPGLEGFIKYNKERGRGVLKRLLEASLE